jgi:hypothetical protein
MPSWGWLVIGLVVFAVGNYSFIRLAGGKQLDVDELDRTPPDAWDDWDAELLWPNYPSTHKTDDLPPGA